MTPKLQAAYSHTISKKPPPKEEEEHLGHYCETCGGELSVHAKADEDDTEEKEILDEETKAALFSKALKEKKS